MSLVLDWMSGAQLDELYQQLLANIQKDAGTGCWNWTGPIKPSPFPSNRYGVIGIYNPQTQKSRGVNAHRAMWIALHGPTERAVYICHRCDNPLCINPRHLFAGSAKMNTHDMLAKNRHNNSRKKVCKRGHPLEGENVYMTPSGARCCKLCDLGRQRIKAGWPPDIAYSLPRGKLGERWQDRVGPGFNQESEPTS